MTLFQRVLLNVLLSVIIRYDLRYLGSETTKRAHIIGEQDSHTRKHYIIHIYDHRVHGDHRNLINAL